MKELRNGWPSMVPANLDEAAGTEELHRVTT
jgi:hypothetical protein